MTFSIYKFRDKLKHQSMTVLDYDVTLEQHDAWDNEYGNNLKYSLVGFKIKLRREYHTQIINYFMPSAIFVMVSWISFLIPPDVIPGRMGLLITLLLVLINLFNSVKVPPATSPSALDIWILSCIFFVTLALAAYASLLYLKKAASFCKQQAINSEVKTVFETRPGLPKTQPIKMKQDQLDNKVDWLDRCFLKIFPLIFIVFNLIYWLCIYVHTYSV